MAVGPSIDLSGWLHEQLAQASPDLLRGMVKTFAEALMGAEADAVCGAPYRERSDERTTNRNGYRDREWDTRAGTVELAIPRLRTGSYFPIGCSSGSVGRRRRAPGALYLGKDSGLPDMALPATAQTIWWPIDLECSGEKHASRRVVTRQRRADLGGTMKIKGSIAVCGAATLAVLGLAPAASAHDGHAATEHVILLSTDPSSNTSTAIATGPIHAAGTDRVLSATKDTLVFPKGSIFVRHHPQHSTSTFDPTTCYGTQTETGTFRVTDGTRAYDDAHGHGTYRLKVTFVGCDQSKPPTVFQLRIDATGPLTLGD